ncbi:MAG: hypothetical protein R3335_01530 [Anaerolineales bacterium]|nr:hypothetical protein [Anaerolineales bacterium]
MKRVALITELLGPDLSHGDSLLVPHLRQLNIHASPVPWDDPSVDWRAYDALVLRACWHYPEQHERFRSWLNELERNDVALWNEPQVVRWNMDKRYLKDLQTRDVPVAPTVWLQKGASPDLNQVLQESGWQAAVVKPQISTGSDNTWPVRSPAGREDQAQFDSLGRERALMVQKLIPEIADGEWSLIFIEGQFAHAVLKVPGAGQIFVQEHRGGKTAPADAPAALVDQATEVVKVAEELTGRSLLYARVDGLWIDGMLVLMELELIEPSLYMRHQPASAARFATAIAGRVS